MLILQLAVSAVLAFMAMIQSQNPASFILGLVTGASLRDLLGSYEVRPSSELLYVFQFREFMLSYLTPITSAYRASYDTDSLSSAAPYPTSTTLQLTATPLPFDIATMLQTYPTQTFWNAPVTSEPMTLQLNFEKLLGVGITHFILCIIAAVIITLAMISFIALLRSYHPYSEVSMATKTPTDLCISEDDYLEYLLSSQSISFNDQCMVRLSYFDFTSCS